MIVVSDTTVITTLLKCGDEWLLAKLFGRVIIPPEVRDELLRYHLEIPEPLDIASLPLGVDPILGAGLGMGERHAIALAVALKAEIFLSDDRKARRAASKAGLVCVGLIGIAIRAKQRGLIASVRELIERLEIKGGLYLSEDLKAEALREAGE